MRRWATLRLFLVLVLFAAAIARPPGTMISSDGDTVTFEICSGGALVFATMPAGGDTDNRDNQDRDTEGCDFFARQFAAVPFGTADVAPAPLEVSTLPYLMVQQVVVQAGSRRSNSPREPPFLS